MKAVVFSFTAAGAELSLHVRECLRKNGFAVQVMTVERYAAAANGLLSLRPNLQAATATAFRDARALVFIGAVGIAVRAVAPYVADKRRDPAVIGVDEKGRFVVPLLSGHIGGANRLARQLADFLGGTAVITTATDVNRLFAVDEWAAQRGLQLFSLTAAKRFAAALLAARPVGFYSDFPVAGPLPAGVKFADSGAVGMAVTLKKSCYPFADTVVLRPRIVHLGIGCRRGISAAQIRRLVRRELRRLDLSPTVIAGIATLDIKQDEDGLLAFAAEAGLALRFYTAASLRAVDGSISPSSFVAQTVGVDNVCERAALRSSGGTLLLPKTAGDGVTMALAVEDFVVSFPEDA